MQILNDRALPSVQARGVAIPAYSRAGAVGVVHLGLGAFHRAHQALVFDSLLQGGDTRWGVLGVSMRSPAVADALAAQDGLYAIRLASSEGATWRVGGAIWQTCLAARERDRVLQAIAAPATRWITLTITEKGYQPALAELVVQGLVRRRAAGLPGLTIASCDNLTHNGRKLQALCVEAASAHGAAFADWMESACAFPNSMVDRIVPAASPAVLEAAQQALGVADHAALSTEAFWEWVVERRFVEPEDADALAGAGVTVVDDVAPFEEAKLRMLNGSHSAMAYIGAVAGLPVVSDCVAMPVVRQFVHGFMTHEIGPQLRRTDWAGYRDALLRRFANPALQHSVYQIASDGSQKIPQRWSPSVMDALRAGRPVERLAFAAAAWMRYLRCSDEQGNAYALRDPVGEALQAQAVSLASDPVATVQRFGRLSDIWGTELPGNTRWLAQVTFWLQQITQRGMLDALAQLHARCGA